MGWAHGHTERQINIENTESKKQDGCIKRGRPQQRWDDCVKGHLRKAEEEEKWREKANNRDRWIFFTNVAYSGVTTRPASPLHNGNQRKNNVIAVLESS